MLNLFQHLKNSCIALYKSAKQARNNNAVALSGAFTLAETLITIGMIGVIAALTLPTLMNSTNDKEIVAKAKKVHSALNEAYGRAYAKYGPVSTWFTSTDSTTALKAQRIGRRMTEFMQVEKDCGLGAGCWANSEVKYPAGYASSNFYSSSANYKVILADGTSLAFSGLISDFYYFRGYSVYFDIDGANKGKNLYGEDVFETFIGDDIVKPSVVKFSSSAAGCNSGAVFCCLDWILNYDNVDYLKVDSSGKCPNGTILSNSNPTCN